MSVTWKVTLPVREQSIGYTTTAKLTIPGAATIVSVKVACGVRYARGFGVCFAIAEFRGRSLSGSRLRVRWGREIRFIVLVGEMEETS